MKRVLLILLSATLFAPSLAGNSDKLHDQLLGTWSGAWIPEGGIRDAMTIELKREDSGKLTGRFITPTPLNFNKVAFNSKTRVLTLEATDTTAGKQYRLNAKVEGTEMKGNVIAGDHRGEVSLIKWTYIPRIKW
jgi:hypothetical protein